jgi:prolyl-tRNA editing enzyme YbaK/EbsC (Cys-tRNA(Pro) deacylase)
MISTAAVVFNLQVSPIGMSTRLPIVISHCIPVLQPDFFFLGGGEVDVKMGLSAAAFVEAYQPLVVDCTYASSQNASCLSA